MALASIGKFNVSPSKGTQSHLSGSEPHLDAPQEQPPLFAPIEELDSDHLDDESGSDIDVAILESWKDQEERDLQKALAASRNEVETDENQAAGAGPSRTRSVPLDEMEDIDLQMALRNSVTARRLVTPPPVAFSTATSYLEPKHSLGPKSPPFIEGPSVFDVSDFFGEPEIPSPSVPPQKPSLPTVPAHNSSPPLIFGTTTSTTLTTEIKATTPNTQVLPVQPPIDAVTMETEEQDDDDMIEEDLGLGPSDALSRVAVRPTPEVQLVSQRQDVITPDGDLEDEADEELYSGWSRSPSPVTQQDKVDMPFVTTLDKSAVSGTTNEDDDWDAAHEMDAEEEEGEFAQFLSQVKGKDLETVRDEIDQEIKQLNQARKNLQRDSEEITQHMVSQIMVSGLSSKSNSSLIAHRCFYVSLEYLTLLLRWKLKRSVRRCSLWDSSKVLLRTTRMSSSSVRHGCLRTCSTSPRQSSAS